MKRISLDYALKHVFRPCIRRNTTASQAVPMEVMEMVQPKNNEPSKMQRRFPSEKHRQAWLQETYLANSSPQVLEHMLELWKTNREMVPHSWAAYFESIMNADAEPYVIQPQMFRKKLEASPTALLQDAAAIMPEENLKVLHLIRSYRVFGHLAADLDPLGLWKREIYPELDYKTYGFVEADLDRLFYVGIEFHQTKEGGKRGFMSLRDILNQMKTAYCGKIGIEYMHIQNTSMKAFMRDHIEKTIFNVFPEEKKKQILRWIAQAEGFEQFLAEKYKTAKRFGLEGSEALIPGLEALLIKGTTLGLNSVVIGMPHRGRLNILANNIKKPIAQIFTEFADKQAQSTQFLGSGDVKYHLGTSADRILENGQTIHLSRSGKCHCGRQDTC
jgi:2-oxoglutarate dehydrogenase E1 component